MGRFSRTTDEFSGCWLKVRRVVAKYASAPFIVGYRISPEEIENPGIRLDDTMTLIPRLIDTGIDYLHFLK